MASYLFLPTSTKRLRKLKHMYNKTGKDWWTAGITAALGAGVVTSLAVSHGQNPLVALLITAIATVGALAIDQVL